MGLSKKLLVNIRGSLRLFSLLFFLVIIGCSGVDRLIVLKNIGRSQKEISNYVSSQEKLFDKLIKHIQDNRLKAGILKDKFINSYGDPVLSSIAHPPAGEKLLYRYPTKYFSSDKVYVYFSIDGKLISWEYRPYNRGK